MKIGHLRKEYCKNGLTKDMLKDEPIEQFAKWFQEAQNAGVPEPNAMTLATINHKSSPRLRTVLLKYFDEKGLVFFTNYESQKARDIDENPQVAMLFPWLTLERQVAIEGSVEKITKAESLKYFLSRPRNSQLGAWCSQQSKIINSRKLLEQTFEGMKKKFHQGKIPLPSFWGGYRVRPERFEFWQGRPNRLHDRFEYIIEAKNIKTVWQIHRLQP